MKYQKKILASIIIVNFNNAKYLTDSLKSVFNQSYKHKEVIVVDDFSTDNSIEVLKKFKKKIKLIKIKKKTKFGSFNQINSYYQGYLKSKGDFIFFLDSDDYFKKNKIGFLIKKFLNDKNIKLIFDLPIYKFKKKKFKKKFSQKKFLISSWPRFSPQSCISIDRKFAEEIFKNLNIRKFETLWFDFRIASYSFIKNNNLHIVRKYLTYYRQLDNSASKKYKTFSKIWWLRRKEAHKFVSYISKKLNKKDRITPDKIITKLINSLIN